MPAFQRSSQMSSRRGQALLVAVILMMVILLTGILFVAIVSYNQEQSTRSADQVMAGNLAQAGIRWCNENLMNSALGADWRPPFRRYNRTTFNASDPTTYPLPPAMDDATGTDLGVFGADRTADTPDDYYTEFELARQWHADVDASTGQYRRYGYYRLPDKSTTPPGVTALLTEDTDLSDRGHILVRVTYDPDPPYEPNDPGYATGSCTPDPMSTCIKIEAIGVVDADMTVFRKMVAYKPLALGDYTLFVTDSDDSGRSAKIGYAPRMDLNNDGVLTAGDVLQTIWCGPMKFNSTLELTGANASTAAAPGPATAGTQFVLTPSPTQVTVETPAYGANPLPTTGGYARDDKIEACKGIIETGGAVSSAVNLRDTTGTVVYTAQLAPSNPAFNTQGGRVLDGSEQLDSLGYSRKCRPIAAPELFPKALDRYRELTRESGTVVTANVNGVPTTVNLGSLGFGAGIYVDNTRDLQFVDSAGVHDLDALMSDWMQLFPHGEYSAENSGWNPTYTLYTAPGVEITLFPSEAAALDFDPSKAVRWQPVAVAAPAVNSVWWPGHRRGDWTTGDYGEPGIRLTRSDGNWAYFDGTDIIDSGEKTVYLNYPRYPNQVIFAEGNVRVHGVLPARNSASDGDRDYNLTIVSGGTIYIDGQILTPLDIYGRAPGDGSGAARRPGGPLRDEENTRVALLARDCVCLNTTRIVPQLTSGEVAAAPDDPANPRPDEQHWELSPEVQGAVYSNFSFGEPVPASHSVNVSIAHTAADPGPAAIKMSVFNGQTGVWTPYTFPGGSNKFLFVEPGAISPANYIDYALYPRWGQLASAAAPAVPWDIRSLINDSGTTIYPGVLKAFSISQTDPTIVVGGAALGGGSTSYWAKKWKISEFMGGLPQGAIHAKVNALIYAENGCWFVIPGGYFDASQTGAMATAFRRYNYDICVRGSITENFHAEPEMVRAWSDKWAWPNADNSGWNTIRYEFDEGLRTPRYLLDTELNGTVRRTSMSLSGAAIPLNPPELAEEANLPKLPLLPVSKDLIFYGEGS